jgi:hypothetical protein
MVGARGFEPPTFPRPAIAACSGRSNHADCYWKKMVGARGFEPPTFPRPAIAACSGRSKQSENIG